MKSGLKNTLFMTLFVLCALVPLAAVASAQGYVFVGVTSYSDSEGLATAVALEYEFTPELALNVEHYSADPIYTSLLARYGAGTGGYGYVGVGTDGIEDWGVGGFFESRVTDKLDARVYVGINNIINDAVIPEVWAELRYDLGGPWAIMGMASGECGELGISFEF